MIMYDVLNLYLANAQGFHLNVYGRQCSLNCLILVEALYYDVRQAE
jgi:hypothetical protein